MAMDPAAAATAILAAIDKTAAKNTVLTSVGALLLADMIARNADAGQPENPNNLTASDMGDAVESLLGPTTEVLIDVLVPAIVTNTLQYIIDNADVLRVSSSPFLGEVT